VTVAVSWSSSPDRFTPLVDTPSRVFGNEVSACMSVSFW
jgi:hypothetical protein